MAIPVKHRRTFEAAQQPHQVSKAFDAYLTHPLAEIEGLSMLPPHLAIFPIGSQLHNIHAKGRC